MSKKKKLTQGQQKTIEDFRLFLNKYYSVPTKAFDMFREALIYDAVTQGKDVKYDRIFCGIALMLHDEFGFGARRIFRGLSKFDEVCGSVLQTDEDGNDIADWPDLMQRLKDETGIVIRTGDDNRLIVEIGEGTD